MLSLIEMDYDFDDFGITFNISGEYNPAEVDNPVGYTSGAYVDKIKVMLNGVNLTSRLTAEQIKSIAEILLDEAFYDED